MLWLVLNGASHEIISTNMFEDKINNNHQLWVTRPGGKSLMIAENINKDEIETIKNAIDFAIESKETTLRL